MNYAIKINKTGRYIEWCDNNWYSTSKEPMYVFSKDEANDIANRLKSHYVYSVSIVSEDGTEDSVGAPSIPISIKPKKSLLKFSLKLH